MHARAWSAVVSALCGAALVTAGVAAAAARADDAKVDFARQVAPIFAQNCVKCHGPDKQRADLRLDQKSAVTEGGASGKIVIPGKSGESLLMQHVTGAGDHRRMPPPPADPLTDAQIATLKAWIDQGAEWPDAGAAQRDPRLDHWSYQMPVHHPSPAVTRAEWVRNPIDAFVLARLEKEKLAPSPEADRETLIRRVTLDLTGLPPTIAEIDAFLADTSPNAYEKVVDRLLASPHYGEHWARWWLDAARYADTNGYEKDRPRLMWRYRDWVIDALNQDMPFDRFTIEQMAGDLLPGATETQRIATAFHRNTMINEEGGIDTEEYRYRSIVDRVATTSTVFLGMTLACSQCHNHKFDPITQKDYYRFFAILNNQDEPMLETPTAAEIQARREVESRIAAVEGTYERSFPLPYERLTWSVLDPAEAKATGGAELRRQEDRSLLATAAAPETDAYTVSATTDARRIVAIRIEALTDTTLPKTGPGRAENGNFVLTKLTLQAAGKGEKKPRTIGLRNASADHAQAGFAASGAIDDDARTGWAVGPAPGQPTGSHVATFELAEPITGDGATRVTIGLEQTYGARHTLGRFRLLVGSIGDDLSREAPAATLAESVEKLRGASLRSRQAAWEAAAMERAADWRVLKPVTYTSEKNCTMNRLDDESILVTGDRPTRDTYTVDYETDVTDITAIRLEAIPDPRLPFHGPGRGSAVADGNFMLNEIVATATPLGGGEATTLKFKAASADFTGEIFGLKHPASAAIDNNLDSGWSVAGAIGQKHWAVFELDKPAGFAKGTRLSLKLIQSFIDQHTLGRFRISVTRKTSGVQASPLSPEIESVLAMPREWWNDAQRTEVRKQYLTVAPELDALHQQVASLRKSIPAYTTTLVLEERVQQPRATHIHIRGEWNQLGEKVEPGAPSALPPLPADQPANRLTLARWLVDGKNPLTARVTMNRVWREYFGRALVETVEDFGMRADAPSHPELLDWLATEWVEQKWSLKAMHRLIVTSATYRQASRVTPELLERDPYNVLVARGPRFRVSGEVIRDLALCTSGLLADRIGGPSVYPPQPEGVTSLAYGGAGWPTSSGADRYRRGLYTFWKRANPYPAILVFDATARDSCTVKRIRSNTPLQALTLLNDPVYIEASQALARRVLEQGPADVRGRIEWAFRLCTGRRPGAAEVGRLEKLLAHELERFTKGEADASKVALPDPKAPAPGVDLRQLAAWTMVSNVLLNLDETVTRG